MLEVGDQKKFVAASPVLSRETLEKAGLGRLHSPPPLIARDAFVIDTSTKLDQLQAEMARMARDLAEMKARVAELRDDTDQTRRYYHFQESEQRTKVQKLDEMVRCCRDLKSRLDKVEAKGAGDYYAYTTFEAISKRLGELGRLEREAADLQRKVRINASLFCGTLALAFLAYLAF